MIIGQKNLIIEKMKRQLLRVIHRKSCKEIYIQLIPGEHESAASFTDKIARILKRYDAKIVRATFFGKLNERENTLQLLKERLSFFDFPYSWIEGNNCTNAFMNGVFIYALSGIEITRLNYNNSISGSYFKINNTEYCCLSGLYSMSQLSPEMQTQNLLDAAEQILNLTGLSFADAIRTWYYLDNILDWYDDFNKVRSSFFHKHQVFKNHVPASTGVGGKNPAGSGLSLELTAIKPGSRQFQIAKVISPLQCPAEEYGSSFSRAIRFSDDEFATLTVSGTASINAEGKTMHKDDLWKQIELTFSVVEAIIRSENFSFSNVVRAYAYFSNKRFHKTFLKYLESQNLRKLSFICSENNICRSDLMFEVELDLVKNNSIP